MSVTTSQVQKVMRASVYARRITTFLMGLMLFGFTGALLSLTTGFPSSTFKFSISSYVFSHQSLQTWPAKLYVMTVLLLIFSTLLGFLYLLRSVFVNLARGEIFCAANVKNIRYMGLLIIAGVFFEILTTLANATIFMYLGHEGITYRDRPFFSNALEPFAYGGMLILLSWIMAVGLGVREDAEELRRDAELVI
jgi:hypothetical protein